VPWDRPFDQPVPLPKGAPARTLRDAATFIGELPKAEQDEREWQTAVQIAAEDRAPMMFVKMAIHQAINRRSSVYLIRRAKIRIGASQA